MQWILQTDQLAVTGQYVTSLLYPVSLLGVVLVLWVSKREAQIRAHREVTSVQCALKMKEK